MKLGIQVSLVPGHIVLDEDPAPPEKGTEPPNFRPMSIVAKRLDGSRFPSDIVLVGDPAPLSTKKGAEPVSIMAKRLGGSICYLVWR